MVCVRYSALNGKLAGLAFVLVYLCALYVTFTGRFMDSGIVPPKQTNATVAEKTVVFFAYHEGSLLEASNLEYFAKAGVWDREDIDFVLIVNGEKCTACLDKSSKLHLPNVRILHRENSGFDFAAYSFALDSTNIGDYRYFIFINGGVRGPILAGYREIASWHHVFTEMLQGNTKLVGPTISCERQIHVQTHMFALEKTGLDAAIAANIFVIDGKSIDDLISHSEIRLTQVMMNKGFDIACLLLQYKSYDWRKLFYQDTTKGLNICNDGRNANVENTWGGTYNGKRSNPSALEVVFFKRGGSIHALCGLKKMGAYGAKETCEYDILVDDLSAWTLAASSSAI